MVVDFKIIKQAQINEITEFEIYSRLARRTKHEKNKKVLERLAKDELKHYNYWKKITNKDFKPNTFRIFWFMFLVKFLGLSFGLRLMERGEETAQSVYLELGKTYKESLNIMLDEQKHEQEILGILEEERLNYASSIVLGLNDALVELTGALAGFTIALQNGKLIGVIGLITGIAAAMSMAASGYLSSKEEDSDAKNPIKSAIYTGIAYLITVFLLIVPFFIISNVFLALGLTILFAVLIIYSYTFYISVAKNQRFWGKFLEMALISIGVAIITFGIGILIKTQLGIDL